MVAALMPVSRPCVDEDFALWHSNAQRQFRPIADGHSGFGQFAGRAVHRRRMGCDGQHHGGASVIHSAQFHLARNGNSRNEHRLVELFGHMVQQFPATAVVKAGP